MKKLLFLLLGFVIITTACQTNTELTDADKDAMVQAVKEASQEYWATFNQTLNEQSFSTMKQYFDENSDRMWQTDPVAVILNTSVTNKQADWLDKLETTIENRISGSHNIVESHYSVLAEDKVLEIIKAVDATIVFKDSTVLGPFTWVNTAIWANIEGEWKIQFNHQSNDR